MPSKEIKYQRTQTSLSCDCLKGCCWIATEEVRPCLEEKRPAKSLVQNSALTSSALQGTLHAVYCSTRPKDEVEFAVELNLAQPGGRIMCQRLWERVLTTPTDSWKGATLNGKAVDLLQWKYPEVPQEGELKLAYVVRLSIKPYAPPAAYDTSVCLPPLAFLYNNAPIISCALRSLL